MNVISIGAGDDKFLDIEDVLPHSQVEKRIIDIKEENVGNVGTTFQHRDFSADSGITGEKNLKAILQHAIKSKLGEVKVGDVHTKTDTHNFEALEIKREILEGLSTPGTSKNSNFKTHTVVAEGIGVASSSTSRKY